MSHKMYVEDRIIILNLWDTAGQERFKSLIPSYIKDSAVAIVVYDITSRQSFQSVDKWIEDAKNLRDNEVLLVLVGNKSDLKEQRQVSTQEAEEYATQRGIMFFELSARLGNNITYTFNEMAKKLTGIETNPISKSEIKNTGFSLGQLSAQAAAQATTDQGGKKKSSKNCANC
jgi:Ras-related protein Rab-6A